MIATPDYLTAGELQMTLQAADRVARCLADPAELAEVIDSDGTVREALRAALMQHFHRQVLAEQSTDWSDA
jgi:anti-sigma factor RsiW